MPARPEWLAERQVRKRFLAQADPISVGGNGDQQRKSVPNLRYLERITPSTYGFEPSLPPHFSQVLALMQWACPICALSQSELTKAPLQLQALRTPARPEGGRIVMRNSLQVWLPIVLVCLLAGVASAQPGYQGGGSFRVQCPTATVRHPGTTATGGTGTVVTPHPDLAEAPYTGPQIRTATKDPTGAHTFTPA